MPNSESRSLRDMPGSHFVDIVKSDSTVLSGLRALWVGGAGNVTIIGNDDTVAVEIKGVAAGTLLPFSVQKVMAATTATLIVGVG